LAHQQGGAESVRAHNRQVKVEGQGVRLVICQLPIKSPWLNPIEPKWTHTKRKVVEPDRLLPAAELVERVCDALGCTYREHIPIPEKAARSCTSSSPLALVLYAPSLPCARHDDGVRWAMPGENRRGSRRGSDGRGVRGGDNACG
jgi:hypothetical protein